MLAIKRLLGGAALGLVLSGVPVALEASATGGTQALQLAQSDQIGTAKRCAGNSSWDPLLKQCSCESGQSWDPVSKTCVGYAPTRVPRDSFETEGYLDPRGSHSPRGSH